MLKFPSFSRSTTDLSPIDLLQWSMDRYDALKTFSADVEWSSGESEAQSSRSIAYSSPNRFRLVTQTSNGFVQTSVCDGVKFVEYAVGSEQQDAMSYPAPPSLGMVYSMFTAHPMFCGTLLLPFFGGRGALDRLVDREKYEPAFLDEPFEAGEPVKTVSLYGAGMYGNSSISLGLETGRVYRITYDSEPLMAMMNDPEHRKMMRRAIKAQIDTMGPGEQRDAMERHLADFDDQGPGPRVSHTTEIYKNIQVDQPIGAETFDTGLPQGLSLRDMSRQGRSDPPLPVGDPAPDFEVTRLGGGPVRLSDLRGQVVFIDFWATWCGPCRRGLPETERLSKLGPSSGLTVLAITHESPGMVSEFLAEEGLSFPCYIDEGGIAQQLYRPPGIPAVVVVDPEGQISDYFIGLQDPRTIEAALRKAGAKV